VVKELITDLDTFEHDEKQRQVILTEYGSEKVEEMLAAAGYLEPDSAGLYDPANVSSVHHVNQALRATCSTRPRRTTSTRTARSS
jgi:preprotein translocase subunit SecA